MIDGSICTQFFCQGTPATGGIPAMGGNQVASPCQPILEYRQGEVVALQERTGQAPQTETQLYHSSSGQAQVGHGGHAGGGIFGRHDTERTNRQRTPKRKPDSTTAAQVKTPESRGERAEGGVGGKCEQK